LSRRGSRGGAVSCRPGAQSGRRRPGGPHRRGTAGLVAWPALFGLLSACAATPPEPQIPAAAATAALSLLWRVETDQGRLLGSATALAPHHLLTAGHVLPASDAIRLRQGDVARSPVRVHRSAIADMVLLDLPEDIATRPILAGAAPPGAALTVAGAARDGSARLGRGVALGGVPGLTTRFGLCTGTARLPVAPGYSGGPIVDDAGHLVGLVVAVLADSPAETRRIAAQAAAGPGESCKVLYLPVQCALALFPAWFHENDRRDPDSCPGGPEGGVTGVPGAWPTARPGAAVSPARQAPG
jgi:hypothetical protein